MGETKALLPNPAHPASMGLPAARSAETEFQVKHISSRSNPAFKALRALATDMREVRQQGRTLIDGPHLVQSYIDRLGAPHSLVMSASALLKPEIVDLQAKLPDVSKLSLADDLFQEVSGVKTPVGVLAVIAIPEQPDGEITGDCVILESVQDSGNVGAILRTAAAAGVRDIFLSDGCAAVWSPRVLRAAQGAHFGLRIRERVDLPGMLVTYGGMSVATVAHDGVSLFELDLSQRVAWVFGNEGAGLSRTVTDLATHRASIPVSGAVESLNVAAAAAICLFERVRRTVAPAK